MTDIPRHKHTDERRNEMLNVKKNGELWDLARAQGRYDWLDYLKIGFADWLADWNRDPMDPQSVMDWREFIVASDTLLDPLDEMKVVRSVTAME